MYKEGDNGKNMYSKMKKTYERKLYMADKSKNEQYDIVAQAEDVLRLYAKRYFEMNKRRNRLPKKKKSRGNIKIIANTAAWCILLCMAVAAIIYFM